MRDTKLVGDGGEEQEEAEPKDGERLTAANPGSEDSDQRANVGGVPNLKHGPSDRTDFLVDAHPFDGDDGKEERQAPRVYLSDNRGTAGRRQCAKKATDAAKLSVGEERFKKVE